MNWGGNTLVVAVVAITAIASTHWAQTPSSRAPSMQGNCSACHKGSAPSTHSRDFIDLDHGSAALANRQECLVCHEDAEESCNRCHQKEAPKWHSPDFLYPALGSFEMAEHIRIARDHRSSCGECHGETYMTRCVDCHRPDEDWLGRGRQQKAESGRSPESVGDYR